MLLQIDQASCKPYTCAMVDPSLMHIVQLCRHDLNTQDASMGIEIYSKCLRHRLVYVAPMGFFRLTADDAFQPQNDLQGIQRVRAIRDL